MKCELLGSRNGWREGKDHAWISQPIELETLPQPGDEIIIDGGSVYVVERCMWFTRSEDEALGGGDLRSASEVETVHVNIRPREVEPGIGLRLDAFTRSIIDAVEAHAADGDDGEAVMKHVQSLLTPLLLEHFGPDVEEAERKRRAVAAARLDLEKAEKQLRSAEHAAGYR
jgi:hypothetical protein